MNATFAADIARDAYLATGLDITRSTDVYGNEVLAYGPDGEHGRFVIGDEYDHDAVAGTDADAPLWGYTWTVYGYDRDGDELIETAVSTDSSQDAQAARDAIADWLRGLTR